MGTAALTFYYVTGFFIAGELIVKSQLEIQFPPNNVRPTLQTRARYYNLISSKLGSSWRTLSVDELRKTFRLITSKFIYSVVRLTSLGVSLQYNVQWGTDLKKAL